MTYYKVLDADGTARMGTGKWHLPKSRPGKWMPKIEGDLIPCENGYHLCREQDLLGWLGPVVFEAEYKGEIIEATDKVVVREARLICKVETWNDRTARLFACDCAERVLHLYEDKHPDDSRVRNCIEISRRVANGDLPVSELAAARAAAWAAAWAAAGAAAWDAARDAAGDASGAAAGAAAWDASRAAERQWQQERLMQYINGDAA